MRRGRDAVAKGAIEFSRLGAHNVDAIVNGAPAAVAMLDGKPISIAVFTVAGGKVIALDVLADPDRIAALDLTVLGELITCCAGVLDVHRVVRVEVRVRVLGVGGAARRWPCPSTRVPGSPWPNAEHDSLAT